MHSTVLRCRTLTLHTAYFVRFFFVRFVYFIFLVCFCFVLFFLNAHTKHRKTTHNTRHRKTLLKKTKETLTHDYKHTRKRTHRRTVAQIRPRDPFAPAPQSIKGPHKATHRQGEATSQHNHSTALRNPSGYVTPPPPSINQSINQSKSNPHEAAHGHKATHGPGEAHLSAISRVANPASRSDAGLGG